MQSKLSIFYVIGFFTLLACLCGACSTRMTETTAAHASENLLLPSADPEINSALKLIEKKPDSPLGFNQLAVVYINQARRSGDFSLNVKAESAVNRALEIAPVDVPSRKLQASLNLTFHRFNEALELGKKLQAELPKDAFVYGVLTDANVELGNYDDAVAAAQQMVDLRPNSSSYARVAHLRSLYGDMKGAVEMFKTAARTADPADAEAQAWCLTQLGDEYWKYGKYVDAEHAYDEALQLLPNYHLAMVGKGRLRASRSDFQQAIEILTSTTNRVPNVEATILLGDIYQKMGETEKARAQYDLVEVIEARLGLNNDQKRLALLWADQDTKLDQALEITRREIDLRKDIFTADARAWTLYKNGSLVEAKTAIADAMHLKTKDARTIYHAGMIEKGLGQKKEARRLLSEALRLNPMFDLLQADNARTALLELR